MLFMTGESGDRSRSALRVRRQI